jgi:hypothetical protein
MLQPSTIQFSARRISAAVAAALVAAAIFVQFDRMPQAAPSAGPAGEANIQMLRDEHASIAGYLKQEAAVRTQADQLAASELERMKVAALEEAQPAHLRLAQVAAPAREEKAKASIVRVAARSEPIRVTTGSAVIGEPMRLLAMTSADTQSAVQPQSRPGIVRGRLRQFATTVESIPSWFNSAAGWVVEAVPVPRIRSLPQFPMHQFRV